MEEGRSLSSERKGKTKLPYQAIKISFISFYFLLNSQKGAKTIIITIKTVLSVALAGENQNEMKKGAADVPTDIHRVQ